jgi:outer membrane protein
MRRALLHAAMCAAAFVSPLLAQTPATTPAQQPPPLPAPAMQAPGSPIRQVTLAEALELSLRASPTMVQARQDVRVAQAQERQTLGAFLPTVNSQATSGETGPNRINATTGTVQAFPEFWSSRIGFSASYPLFTGFQRGAARHQAQATTSQRDATLLRQEYATALATKQVFFQALAFAELVTVQQTRLRGADEQLKLTTERLRLGATTRSDSLRAQVEYGNAQLALIQAQANLRVAQANLGRAIQVDGLATPIYDSTLGERVQNLDTAALREQARGAAPSVREAQASLAASRAALRASRASYLPTLALSGQYNWAAGDTSVHYPYRGKYANTWNLNITASYPIFNGFQRETGVTTADANVESAQSRLLDARLALDASLTQQYAALEAAAARIDVSQTSVAAATEDLRMQRERYRLGAVTIIEVLTSQANLDQAQVDFVQARYDYLVARAQIEALVGHGL